MTTLLYTTRKALSQAQAGETVRAVFACPHTGGTYIVIGQLFVDDTGPDDALCVGNDTVAVDFGAGWIPDELLRGLNPAPEMAATCALADQTGHQG